jgi:hypothetical protein
MDETWQSKECRFTDMYAETRSVGIILGEDRGFFEARPVVRDHQSGRSSVPAK